MEWWIVCVMNSVFLSLGSCFPSCEHYLNRRKQGVFHYDRHSRYQLTYHIAETTCQQDFGATLATRDQLLSALQSGLEECRAGWITSGEVAYPRIHKHWNCGENKTGIISYGIRQNLQEKWDVFCYKEGDDCSHYNRAYSGLLITTTEPSSIVLNELFKAQSSNQTFQLESITSPTIKTTLNFSSPAQSPNSHIFSSYVKPTDRNLTSFDLSLHISPIVDPSEPDRNSSENQIITKSVLDNPDSVTSQETFISRAGLLLDDFLIKYNKSCQSIGCTKAIHISSSSTVVPMFMSTEKVSVVRSEDNDPINKSNVGFSQSNKSHLTTSPELQIELNPSPTSANSSFLLKTHSLLEQTNFLPTNETSKGVISKSVFQSLTNPDLEATHLDGNITPIVENDTTQETYITSLTLKSPMLTESSFVLTQTVDSLNTNTTSSMPSGIPEITKEVHLQDPKLSILKTWGYPYKNKGSKTMPKVLESSKGYGDLPLEGLYVSLTTASPSESHQSNTTKSNLMHAKNKTDLEISTLPKNKPPETKGTEGSMDVNYQTNMTPFTSSQLKELFNMTVRNHPLTYGTAFPTLPTGDDISISTPEGKSGEQKTYKYGSLSVASSAYGKFPFTLDIDTTAFSVTSPSMKAREESKIFFNVFPDKVLDTCGGLLEEHTGRFQSPGFPQSYVSHMNCTWVIEAPLGYYITLDFIALVLEEHKNCLYDHILVYDGKQNDDKLLGRFCGLQIPPKIQTMSSKMTVIMKSDSSVELDGFLVQYRIVQHAYDGIRLKGGQNLLEGEVEFQCKGIRGSICAKRWTNKEAQVVCRQLGYSGPAVATRIVGQENVAISFVICNGDEEDLQNCSLKNTGFCGTKERAGVLCQVFESCAALKIAGFRESGPYTIDPDGVEHGENHFTVECDMESDSTTGITVIKHDSESRERVSPCGAPGCYSRIITYKGASVAQLRSLTSVSESCEQFVRLECRNINFLNGPWGWWVSSDGQQIASWGGATTNSGRCACGENGNCALGISSCNCDANDDVWRMDEGALTDKSILPVREVRFGNTRNVPMQMAFHNIGKLRCWGTVSEPPVLESCAALKKAGISDSGRYSIDPDGVNHGVDQFEVYCDMSSNSGITVIGHDSERRTRVTPCEEAGCYRRELKYTANLSQLNALTKVSESCEQFVRLDCRHLRFLQSSWGWWVSWDGNKMNYWGGANPASGGCACGKSGTCSSPDKICNCDSNDHVWRTDDGFLRDKEALPVQAVHFGDTDEFPVEMAYHTIGKLRCRGQEI